MAQKVIIFSQYWSPEPFPILSYLEDYFAVKNIDLYVVTSLPNYPHSFDFYSYAFRLTPHISSSCNITYIRLPVFPRGNNALSRALNYISFPISLFVYLIFNQSIVHSAYIFAVAFTPLSSLFPLYFFQKNTKKSFLWIQDLWPDSFRVILPQVIYSILAPFAFLANSFYRSFDFILLQSAAFKDFLPQFKSSPRYKILHNCFSSTQVHSFPPIANNVINIAFTGNIGYAQNLKKVINIISLVQQLSSDYCLRYHVYGDGAALNETIEYCHANNFSFVHFHGRVSSDELVSRLSSIHVLQLSLIDVYPISLTIPSKFQFYLSQNRPILSVGSGYVSDLVEDKCLGHSFYLNPSEFSSELYRLNIFFETLSQKVDFYLESSRTLYIDHYSQESFTSVLDQLFDF